MQNFILKQKHYILFGFFFACFFCLLLLSPRSGNDYWWHVKAGEWIVQNKTVPMTGIYSWYATELDLSWFAHEWLAEIVLYGFSFLFGENGGIIYILISLILLGVLLYLFNYQNYTKNLFFSIFWCFAGIFAIGSVSSARPHLLSLCFFTLLLYVCERIKKDPHYKFYFFFPIISLLWANFHGGSSNLVYIVPLIYLIANSYRFKLGRIQCEKIPNSYNYLILTVINTCMLFINPRTYQLLYYPYSYTDEHAKYITEWMSPSFTNGIFALILIIIICIIFFITPNTINFSDLSLIGCFMLLTLKSVRFEAWLYIVATMIIFKYIGEFIPRKFTPFLSYILASSGIIILFASIYCYNSGKTYVKSEISDEAIEILKNEDFNHLMNYYNYGGYLIYHDIDVFIDGRADMYSGYNLTQHAESIRYTYDYLPQDFLDEFDLDFDMFVLPKKSYFAYYLETNNAYIQLYTDDNTSIFKKIK